MAPRSVKECPNCHVPAAIDVSICPKCGRRYRTLPKQNEYASWQRTTSAGDAPNRISSRQTVSGASRYRGGFLALLACAIIFTVVTLKVSRPVNILSYLHNSAGQRGDASSSEPETLEWVPEPDNTPATIKFERESCWWADYLRTYDIYALHRLKAQDAPEWVKVGSVGDGGATELKCVPIRDSSSSSPGTSYKVSLSIRSGSQPILSPQEFTAYPGSVTKAVLTKSPDHLAVSTEDEGNGGREVQLITLKKQLEPVTIKQKRKFAQPDEIIRDQDTITEEGSDDFSERRKFEGHVEVSAGVKFLLPLPIPAWLGQEVQVGLKAEIEDTINHHYKWTRKQQHLQEWRGNGPYIEKWIQWYRTGKARVKNPDGTVVDIRFEFPDSSEVESVPAN